MSTTVTFDDAPPQGTINMGIGQPSADLLPVDLLHQASDAFYADAQPIELNYGVMQGDERFLDSLASFLTQHYGSPVQASELFTSGGNSQALNFICGVFSQPGDTIFVEEPSYFLAFQIFRDHGLNIVGIPVDEDGLNIDALQAALEQHSPTLLYTIPSFHNPGGQTLSAERRQQLVNLSTAHDFLIVADEVYQLLSFQKAPPPAMGTMIESGTVLSLGSFSKILAPALRLGWIQCAPPLRARLLASGLTNSGGCINHYASHIARLSIDLGLQDRHLNTVRATLRKRCDAMDEALQQHFSALAQWQKPAGGYFFWLAFSPELNTTPLKQLAIDAETGFQPGAVFSSKGGLKHCMRLGFSHYNEAELVEGIERLRSIFDPIIKAKGIQL